MFRLRHPGNAEIAAFRSQQSSLSLSYSPPGMLETPAPPGFVVDRNSAVVGTGEEAFRVACEGIRRWEMFRLEWVELHAPPETPQPGMVVAIVVRCAGAWTLNACRVLSVIDESPSADERRFGIVYGTLPGHAECGEERFLVEWRRSDDTVRYEILAYSRPRHVLARLGRPITRMYQKRFARDSLAAMRRFVSHAGGSRKIGVGRVD